MFDPGQPYRVAVVAAPSVPFDLDAGIARAIELMADAAAEGARLLAFGELWLPGYPVALNHEDDWLARHRADYTANSLVVGSRGWDRLCAAAGEHGLHVCIGYSERDGSHLYMGQALIGGDGRPLLVRRKLRPSGAERRLWSDGEMSGLRVAQTELGRVGALQCWEHLRTHSSFNLMAQREQLHVCAWPYVPGTTASTPFWERDSVALAAARCYALQTGAYVLLPAVGRVAVFGPDGVEIAEAAADAGEPLLFAFVDPARFNDGRADPVGEHSWGVLQALCEHYPGPRVPDPEHGVRHVAPLS